MYDFPHDGALHTADLGTVFGTQSMIANTIVPEAVTQIVQQAWVSFAQTGTPTVYGVEWPVVHAHKPMQALVFGEQVKVVSFESTPAANFAVSVLITVLTDTRARQESTIVLLDTIKCC